MAADLSSLTLVEVAAALVRGESSSLEVTRALLERIDHLDPTLNAYVTVLHESALDQAKRADAERARGEPRGPLHGVPIAV